MLTTTAESDDIPAYGAKDLGAGVAVQIDRASSALGEHFLSF